MFQRRKKAIDKGQYISMMYLDLSKASDTINHDFLLAKLRACNFSKNYLKKIKPKVVISNKTGSYEVVTATVPKVSVEGPFLSNLFIIDIILFLCITLLSNYADVSNLYATGNDKEKTERALVEDFQTVID